MKVRDICSLDVRSCRPDSNLAAAASIMWERDCGVVPVINAKNKVVGVVTDRDICMAVATRAHLASEIRVDQLMSGKVHMCRLDDDIKSAVHTMTTSAVRRLPVLNDAGELAGVLSLSDVVLASRHPKLAETGDLSWSESVPLIEAICRPRATATAEPAQRKPALAVARS